MNSIHATGASTYLASPGRMAPAGRPEPEVLFYTDVDDSLVGWNKYNVSADEVGLARTRMVLDQHPEVLCVPSTSRGLVEMQRLAGLFKGYPLQFIGLNGGQQLFVNQEARPADEWILGLTQDQADTRWAGEVAARTGGWRVETVMDSLRSLLADEGFRAEPQLPPPYETMVNFSRPLEGTGDRVAISFYPDQPGIAVRNATGDLTPETRQYGEAFIAKLKDRLASQGVPLDTRVFPYGKGREIYMLEPRNLTKSSLLEHLLGRFPSLHAVVTAGDNTNDDMLLHPSYGDMPNHRLVAGERQELRDALKDQPNVIFRPSGDLGPGLEEYLGSIAGDQHTATHPGLSA